MSRLVSLILAFALFASVTFTFASPVLDVNERHVDIEKRDTRTGRVTPYFFFSQSTYTNYRTLQQGHLVLSWFGTLLYLLVNGRINLILGLGNCGRTDTSADLILAISKQLYDSNRGSNCAQVKFHPPSYCYPRWSFLYTVGVRWIQWSCSVWLDRG
jgi:hypothetical protein